MLRIFLVEDESIIRETLRDTVPWAQYGYTFAGEAGDGEMALPPSARRSPTCSSPTSGCPSWTVWPSASWSAGSFRR